MRSCCRAVRPSRARRRACGNGSFHRRRVTCRHGRCGFSRRSAGSHASPPCCAGAPSQHARRFEADAISARRGGIIGASADADGEIGGGFGTAARGRAPREATAPADVAPAGVAPADVVPAASVARAGLRARRRVPRGLRHVADDRLADDRLADDRLADDGLAAVAHRHVPTVTFGSPQDR
jgi:hypothetical protein